MQKGVGERELLVLNSPLPGRGLSQKVDSLESTVEKREQALKTGKAEVPLGPGRRCEHAQCVEKCPEWALCRVSEHQELPSGCHS